GKVLLTYPDYGCAKSHPLDNARNYLDSAIQNGKSLSLREAPFYLLFNIAPSLNVLRNDKQTVIMNTAEALLLWEKLYNAKPTNQSVVQKYTIINSANELG